MVSVKIKKMNNCLDIILNSYHCRLNYNHHSYLKVDSPRKIEIKNINKDDNK